MKIEKINENKIKVTLSINDLQERNIDLNALSYNSPQAQRLFMDMMHIAESEHGFLVGENQVFIEALPTPPEGFEIIVTKVEDDKDFESIHKYIKNKLKRSDLSSKKKSRRVTVNVYIYSFNTFEDLCAGVNEMDPYYSGESSLYKYQSAHYLVIPKSYRAEVSFEAVEMSLNEFGTKVSNSAFFEGILNEYGEKLIEDNAIEVIRNYFI